MKAKTLIIIAIIVAVITIALGWISSSEIFGINLPWIVTSSPYLFFFLFILLPYVAREGKRRKDKDDK